MRVTATGHAALRRTARALADGRLASQGIGMGDPVAEQYLEEVTDVIAERLTEWIEGGCATDFEITLPTFEDCGDEIRADLEDREGDRMYDLRGDR